MIAEVVVLGDKTPYIQIPEIMLKDAGFAPGDILFCRIQWVDNIPVIVLENVEKNS